LAQDRPALLETLSGLRDKGLLRSKGDVWELAGPLWRLASFRRSQRTVALTRRRGGTAHTRVLHRFGGVALVVDLEPSAVRLREYPLEGAFSLLAR
jgi:hypothetical protein